MAAAMQSSSCSGRFPSLPRWQIRLIAHLQIFAFGSRLIAVSHGPLLECEARGESEFGPLAQIVLHSPTSE